jgi:hypothetical protein
LFGRNARLSHSFSVAHGDHVITLRITLVLRLERIKPRPIERGRLFVAIASRNGCAPFSKALHTL